MKSFRKLVSEVAQPKAGDEVHFKAKHEVEKFPHSHAGDETFKGATKKAPKRIADHEKGDDQAVYEAKKLDPVGKEDDDIDNDGDVDSSDKYLHSRRKAISKAMKKEAAEELDEISKKTLGSYVKKASDDMANNAYTLGARDPLKPKGSWGKSFKRRAGIAKATDRLTKEEVELDEARKSSSYQFTHKPGDAESEKKLADLKKSVKGTGKRVVLQGRLGKDNPNAHKYSKDAPRAQYNDGKRVNSDVSGKSGAHSHQRIQKADAAHHDVYVYDRNESVELSELSPNLLHRYIKKSTGDAAGTAAGMGADAAKGKVNTNSARKLGNRMKGISGASGRLADKANMAENAWEEVPMMMRQLQFITYAAEEIMEYLDTDVDPEEWFQNKLANIHEQMQTLQAYAEGDMRMMSRMGGMYGEEVELDEASPTKKAITRALQGMKVQPKDKISVKKAPWEKNEETQLEEAVKPGRLKLDDGATVTVSKNDADVVNQMFNDLNAKNRKKMQDTMMSDKAGFDEIVGFAKEAL